MNKKKTMVSIISTVLALVMLLSAVLIVALAKKETPDEQIDESQGENERNEEMLPSEEEEFPAQKVPEKQEDLPDFDDGNESLLDEGVIYGLTIMERGEPMTDAQGNYLLGSDGSVIYTGGDENAINTILDALILLVNYAANNGYSVEANHQMQRLYFEYYELFNAMSIEERHNKLSACIPATGAVVVELNKAVQDALGLVREDGFEFVVTGKIYDEDSVPFYNVKPMSFDLQALEELCMYSSLHGIYDDGTERNLEAWLHNIIRAVKNAGLSDQYAQLAQLLYAHSLFDAAYAANWEARLIECLSVEELTFCELKEAVNANFGVDITDNALLRIYVESTWGRMV